MNTCKGCGAELSSGQLVCLECGTRVTDARKRISIEQEGTNSLAFFFLGLLFPQAGLAIGVVWNKDKPHAAGGALAGFFVGGLIQGFFILRALFFE